MATVTLNTVTGPITSDKLGRVLAHEHVMIGYPGWEADTLRRGPRRAEAVAIGSGRQHRHREVDDDRAHAHRVGVLRRDHHAIPRGQVARRRQSALALDVDQAGTAGAERRAVGILAELRQRDPQPVDGLEDRRPLGQLDRTAVDGDDHDGLTPRRTRRETPPGR